MVKKITSLNIDSDVVAKAKHYGFNMSEIAEEALKKQCGIKNIEIDENDNTCFFCGEKFEFATIDHPDRGLTLLAPDEKWICHNCLKLKIKKMIFGKNA